MATGNNETNHYPQLALFEEPSTGLDVPVASEGPLAAPSLQSNEEVSAQAVTGQTAEGDEVLTEEQEADLERNLEFGNFNRASALGRAGVRKRVEVEPVQPRKPRSTRRRYTPRNDPDYQAAPWNER